jgi:hypothetical protein
MMKTRLQEIWKRIATPPPESISEAACLWGAGMVVDTQSFSSQLSRLQNSLATQGVAQKKPTESLVIKSGSESNA